MTSLPTVNTSTYQTTLPSNGLKIKYRPFLVKEEKIMLMAMDPESKKLEKEMLSAVKEVVRACTFDKLDMDALPLIDLEWLFVQLRMKSKGETIDAVYKCPKCQSRVPTVIDLEQAYIKKDEKFTDKIDIDGKVGVKMLYPTFETIEKVQEMDESKMSVDDTLALVAEFIDFIYDKSEIYKVSDVGIEKVVEFLESLTEGQLKKITDFLNKQPLVAVDVNFSCQKCGYNDLINLKGLNNFFA